MTTEIEFPKDPFTESEIAPGVQFNHHAFATDENYKIDVAEKIGEVLALVHKEAGPEVTRFIVRISGLSNYVSYRE
jgi:hypothetical protein